MVKKDGDILIDGRSSTFNWFSLCRNRCIYIVMIYNLHQCVQSINQCL